MSHEIELKLTLPQKSLAALRRHPLIADAPREGRSCTLENTYFDTPELELRERRMAVRTRKAGSRWLQTVKCAAETSGGLSSRPEWEQPYANACFDFSAIDRLNSATISLTACLCSSVGSGHAACCSAIGRAGASLAAAIDAA